MTTAARLLVEQLRHLGADTVFGVPGESYLAVLDALVDAPELRFVTCRQESGATFAADAHARLTGRPGVAMVTRGPGATNASIGIHTALHDEVPLLLFVGLIPSHMRGRDAFQEFDPVTMFASLAKAVIVVDAAASMADVVADAWYLSCEGRPGPVVIGLPEDVLEREAAVAPASMRPMPSEPIPPDLIDRARALIADARRPLAIVGGSTWDAEAIASLPEVLADIPIATAFRHQDLVDDRSRSAVGVFGLVNDPALVVAVREADLIVAIGTRLDDPTTSGYTLIPDATPLVHVHPSAAEVGRNRSAAVEVVARPGRFLEALGRVMPTVDRGDWADRLRSAHLEWQQGGDELEAMVRLLGESLAHDTIVTNGAGNFTKPFHRSFPYGRPGRQLAPANGSMGYGLPAALAAALTCPDRPVLCVAGDGDLLMTGQELATAAAHGARLTVLVVDNGSFGTIRTHQERRYPGRRSATDLVNPDFVAWAQSFGAKARRASSPSQAAAMVAEWITTAGVSVVHLQTDI